MFCFLRLCVQQNISESNIAGHVDRDTITVSVEYISSCSVFCSHEDINLLLKNVHCLDEDWIFEMCSRIIYSGGKYAFHLKCRLLIWKWSFYHCISHNSTEKLGAWLVFPLFISCMRVFHALQFENISHTAQLLLKFYFLSSLRMQTTSICYDTDMQGKTSVLTSQLSAIIKCVD